MVRSFNPRTRESATCVFLFRFHFFPCFNPRTRESATNYWYQLSRQAGVSIHALVRVRQNTRYARYEQDSFNPRTRESATTTNKNLTT